MPSNRHQLDLDARGAFLREVAMSAGKVARDGFAKQVVGGAFEMKGRRTS